MTHPHQSPEASQLVPVEVAFAVYGMWASLLLSVGFALYELLASSSVLDPAIRAALFACNYAVIKAFPAKKLWARYVAVFTAIVFYAFLALDADGLTRTDFWHMLVKTPLDLFVISRLFKPSVALWLREI